jgi:hypothetical protein
MKQYERLAAACCPPFSRVWAGGSPPLNLPERDGEAVVASKRFSRLQAHAAQQVGQTRVAAQRHLRLGSVFVSENFQPA